MGEWKEIAVGSGRGFRAYRSSALSIPNATHTEIVFNTESFDTENEYSTSTGRYTPQVAGYYHISGNAIFDNISGETVFQVYSSKNGGSGRIAIDRGLTGSISAICGGCATGMVYLNGSSDYVSLWCYHNHGSSRDLYTGGSLEYNSFCGWLLFPK